MRILSSLSAFSQSPCQQNSKPFLKYIKFQVLLFLLTLGIIQQIIYFTQLQNKLLQFMYYHIIMTNNKSSNKKYQISPLQSMNYIIHFNIQYSIVNIQQLILIIYLLGFQYLLIQFLIFVILFMGADYQKVKKQQNNIENQKINKGLSKIQDQQPREKQEIDSQKLNPKLPNEILLNPTNNPVIKQPSNANDEYSYDHQNENLFENRYESNRKVKLQANQPSKITSLQPSLKSEKQKGLFQQNQKISQMQQESYQNCQLHLGQRPVQIQTMKNQQNFNSSSKINAFVKKENPSQFFTNIYEQISNNKKLSQEKSIQKEFNNMQKILPKEKPISKAPKDIKKKSLKEKPPYSQSLGFFRDQNKNTTPKEQAYLMQPQYQNLQKDQRNSTDQEDEDMKQFEQKLINVFEDSNKKPSNKNQKNLNKMNAQGQDQQDQSSFEIDIEEYDNEEQNEKMVVQQQIEELLPIDVIITSDLASLQPGQTRSPSTGIYYKNSQQEFQLQRFIDKYGIDKRQVMSKIEDLFKLQNIYVTNQNYTKNDPKLIKPKKRKLNKFQDPISAYYQQMDQLDSQSQKDQKAQQQLKENQMQQSQEDNKKQFFEYYLLKDFQCQIPKETYEIYNKLSKQIDSYGKPDIQVQLAVIQVKQEKKPQPQSIFYRVGSNPQSLNNTSNNRNFNLFGLSPLRQNNSQEQQQKEPQKTVQITFKYKGNLIGKITDKSVSGTLYLLKSLIELKLIIDYNFLKLDLIDIQRTKAKDDDKFYMNYSNLNEYKYRAILRLSLNYQKYHKIYGKHLLKNYTNMMQNLQIEESRQKMVETFGKLINSINSLPSISKNCVKFTQEDQMKKKQKEKQKQKQKSGQNFLTEYLQNLQKSLSQNRQNSLQDAILFSRQNYQRYLKQNNISSFMDNTKNRGVQIGDSQIGVRIGGSQNVIKQKKKEQKKSILRQNIFDSQSEIGKFFDLTQNDIQQQTPSMLFKGHLKKYQKRALAWMLHRQQCPIYFDYGSNKYQYQWHLLWNTQNLYMNQPSLYIRPYLPVDRKIVRGGILADQMGLGKTIMSVALIATHIKKEIDFRQRYQYSPKQIIKAGTLIVVPLAILNQWKKVFQQYLPNFKCLQFYGKTRNYKYDQIVKSQIVITTQSLLKNERNIIAKEGSKLENGKSLYHYEWFRIIIDQSHSLRNQKCQYFVAAKEINARYRWLLTGTPLQNRLEDLQSLLSFLQYKPWSDFNIWQQHFKRSELGSQNDLMKIKSIIKGIVIRRKKQSKDQEGNQLLQIAPHKSMKYEVYLSQKVYKKYRKISKSILNPVINFQKQYDTFDPSKPNQSMNVYDNKKKRTEFQKRINKLMLSTFQKLTKMRQFCCHPSLYYSRSKFITYEQFPRHFERFLELQEVSNKRRTIKQIKKQKSNLRQSYLFDTSMSYQERKRIRQKLQEHALDLIMSHKPFFCALCNRQMKSKHNGFISICLHFYCEKCFKGAFKKIKKQEPKKQQNKTIRQNISKKKSLKCKSPSCFQQLFYNQVLSLPRINRFGDQPIYNIEPNQKIQFIIDYLNQSKNQEKIIVFTSFVGMVQLLIQTFKRQQINYLTMIGQDSHETRTKRLTAFRQDPLIKVFVISLKCGYAGLNLQMANKVIFCQTWWNPAIQDQAIGRLHRMGQQKEVQVIRLITKNTIQEQMHIINQEKKLKSEFVLDSDENQGEKRNKRLSKVFQIKQMLLKSLQEHDVRPRKKNQCENENMKEGQQKQQKKAKEDPQQSSDSSSQQQDQFSQEDGDNEQLNQE